MGKTKIKIKTKNFYFKKPKGKKERKEMEQNDLIEDGEIPSSPDDAEGPYKPLQRPVTLEHKYKNKDEPVEDDFDNRSEDNDESDDSDCDNAMIKRMKPNKMEVVKDAGGGGDVFKQLAANFQASIHKNQRSNNVWGSFLQEDSLNSDIQNFGVGRNLKDIQSDRGAETYDYFAATNEKRASSQRNSTESMEQKDSATVELNAELDAYWNNKREDKEDDDRKRRTEAIQAGKKEASKKDWESESTKTMIVVTIPTMLLKLCPFRL